MGAFIVRRLIALVPLLLLISFAVFALVLVIPGDPARTLAGGTHADPAKVVQIRHQLHLDQPLVKQYWRWLSHAVRGNLGTSIYPATHTVSQEIAHRFPITLSLTLAAMVVSLIIGIPGGILAGLKPGSARDRSVTFGTSLGIAMPDFWVAMILVVLFAVKTHLLPAIGYVGISQDPAGWLRDMALPCIALGLAGGATIARQLRGSLIDAMDQDYIRTARAMGLRRRTIIGKYALKNAATPVLTLVGLQFAYLLGGTFIIEQIFSIPGMGSYMLGAIQLKDLPKVQGVVLVTAVIFVVVNLVVDVGYGFLSPKVRVS
ncbi:MAG TPA: ABC transporter permease [Acidimicrobiia bacterium]|nr:ABC transporter permease [Acidimicrobiia bacterium]